GMEPGGNMAILAYKKLLDEQGMPKMHEGMFNDVFNKEYYAKKRPIWSTGDFAFLLGDAGLVVPENGELIAFFMVCGMLIGLMMLLISFYIRKGDEK
ncbi:MAG: hypothetical protein RLZZ384_150, partial [Pseudomonadota bacterium]